MHFTWGARKPGLLSALVGLSLFAILPANGQFQRGTIVGALTDESGAAIARGKITLKNLGTNEERSAVSDERGDYTFALLLPGSYNVNAEAPGFKTQVVNDIHL